MSQPLYSQTLTKEREVYMPLRDRQESPRKPRRGKSFNLSRSKLPLIVAVLLFGYLAASFTSQFSKLSAMQKEIANIEMQVQELKDKNTSLRKELQLVQSDAFIEKTARDKLGLVKPGETRVVSVPEGTELKKIQPPSTENVVSD